MDSAAKRLEQRRPKGTTGKLVWERHNGSRERRRRQRQFKAAARATVYCPTHPMNTVNPEVGVCSECLAAKFT